MTTTQRTRIERSGHLRWLPVSDLRVEQSAQREFRPGWAATIAAEFDPDKFGTPTVSMRGGKPYVVDGQHRVGALKIMGWLDQEVQCWVYEGLSLAQEADLFLDLNNRKAIRAFDTFAIGVTAERPEEVDIDRVVRLAGLTVSERTSNGVAAVGALRKVYRHGPNVLARTLCIVRDAYGDSGLRGEVIEGIGLVCARYNGELNDETAVHRLQSVRGGLGALTTKAAVLKKQLGRPLPVCIGGAAVDIINSGRGGKKLAAWWS